MTERSTDYKVIVTLDRKALVEDIDKLVHILARQRPCCIVSAVNEAEALVKTEERLKQHYGIPAMYIKDMLPRKLPT